MLIMNIPQKRKEEKGVDRMRRDARQATERVLGPPGGQMKQERHM